MSLHKRLFDEQLHGDGEMLPTDYCRWCFDLFSGSEPSGSATTTVSNRPIPAVEDALGRLLPQAEALAGIPVNAPDFDTVVPFSFQTEDALQLQEQRALGGSPLEQGAQDIIGQTLRGDFLQRENPGFQALAQRLTGDIGSNINALFSESGRLGSQGNAQALGRGVGDALAPLAFQDFQRERQNQLAAAEFAPQLAQIDFQNIAALRDVGIQREGQLGAEVQDELNRFNFAEQEPRQRIAEVLALIGGGQFGNQSQQTRPTFSSGSGAINNIAGLASIAKSLFG
jgi:hypothetical protein